MRLVYSILVTLLLFSPSFSHAETKEIISEGTYNMGDGETPSVAESRALLKAKQIALEQAGTYVESYSKVKNITLTQDEIQVLASGLMEVEILNKKRTVVGDGINFWVKIKAKVNPDKMEEMAKRVKEKSVVEDYKRIQEAYEKSQREIEELKKQLLQTKDEEAKKKLEARILNDEKLHVTNEWLKKGYMHNLNKEYDEAVQAYTNALKLNPTYEAAYAGRGIAYHNRGRNDKAIVDFNKAIALSPMKDIFDEIFKAQVFYERGRAYLSLKNKNNAISDFRKACDMGDETSCQELGKIEQSK